MASENWDDDAKSDGNDMNDGMDAEGVWSPDIEDSFREALAIYPPCGRRKIILSDEGKMYGRNELIARYIKLRTGKTRSRKQVSSHIQVLSRRKTRELTNNIKDDSTRQTALKRLQNMSSAQIVSAPAIAQRQNNYQVGQGFIENNTSLWVNKSGTTGSVHLPYIGQTAYGMPGKPRGTAIDATNSGHSLGTNKFKLLEFSAFMESHQEQESYNRHLFVHLGPSYMEALNEAVDIRQIYDKFPEKKDGLRELYDRGPQGAFFLVKFWADLSSSMQDESGAFYGITSVYESTENMVIECSTKLCSFGKQVVEKVETEYSQYENGHFVYRISRSPMCEYMIDFIRKLKTLPEKHMMNSVLENFTVLQVVKDRESQETLLCVAYAFEVSTSEHGTQHHIYRLVKD